MASGLVDEAGHRDRALGQLIELGYVVAPQLELDRNPVVAWQLADHSGAREQPGQRIVHMPARAVEAKAVGAEQLHERRVQLLGVRPLAHQTLELSDAPHAAIIAAAVGRNNPRLLGLTVPVAATKLPGMMNATTISAHIPTAQAGAAVLAPGEGELLTVRGNRLVIKVASERQSVVEYTGSAGFPGPPQHVHPGFDEVFLVLEGHLTVRTGDEVSRLEPGSLAFVPGAVPHTFANTEAEPVRFLLLCAPGGFEDYFRAVAAGDEAAMAEAEHRVGYAPVGHPDDER